MDTYLLGLKFGTTLTIIVVGIFGFIGVIYLLAKLNIFFTLVKEGTAKAIMRFNKFSRIVVSYKNHEVNDDWDVVEEKPNSMSKLLKLFGGLRFVGLPIINTVYRYKFKWTSYEQLDESGKTTTKPKTKEEFLDFILVQDDVYFTFLDAAETKGMVPVDVSLLLTLRIKNPYKALFKIQHWLEATLNLIKPAFRSFVADKKFEDLVAQKEAIKREVGSFISETRIDEEILRNYGVEIVAVEMVEVGPAGERGSIYVGAATKLWEAEKESERIMKLADAEIERVNRVYGAVKGQGKEGLFLRTLESVEQAGKEPGKFIIFPLGGVKDLMKMWTGSGEKDEKKEG